MLDKVLFYHFPCYHLLLKHKFDIALYKEVLSCVCVYNALYQ